MRSGGGGNNYGPMTMPVVGEGQNVSEINETNIRGEMRNLLSIRISSSFSLSLSSQCLIDVLFRLMNYARKVTICRYFGIGSTRKLFTRWRENNNIQHFSKLPIVMFLSHFGSHSFYLSVEHNHLTDRKKGKRTYHNKVKRNKTQNPIETRNVPLHLFHPTFEILNMEKRREKKHTVLFHSLMNIHKIFSTSSCIICFIEDCHYIEFLLICCGLWNNQFDC